MSTAPEKRSPNPEMFSQGDHIMMFTLRSLKKSE